MTVDEANYIVQHYYFDVLEFCGCYTPEVALNLIEEGLERFDRDGDKEWVSQTEWVDNNLILAYLLSSLDLTEHGGGIGGSWLTAKGKKLLEALKLSNDKWEDFEKYGYNTDTFKKELSKFKREWL